MNITEKIDKYLTEDADDSIRKGIDNLQNIIANYHKKLKTEKDPKERELIKGKISDIQDKITRDGSRMKKKHSMKPTVQSTS